VIFPDTLTIIYEKPYKFELTINSNSNEEENHLKMLLITEWPTDYPNNIPFMRLKNLSS
jgi:hypothetical protein